MTLCLTLPATANSTSRTSLELERTDIVSVSALAEGTRVTTANAVYDVMEGLTDIRLQCDSGGVEMPAVV